MADCEQQVVSLILPNRPPGFCQICMVTLESSLVAVKMALAQFGASASANSASELASTSQSTVAGGSVVVSAATPSSTLSLSQASTKALDMQRQLDSAYTTQIMLEVVAKANAAITARLKDLRKITVQASIDRQVKSERAALIAQFEGVRQSLLSQTRNTLGDGMAGSKRDGQLSFPLGTFEVQPDHPLMLLLKHGSVDSAMAARSTTAAIDLSLQTLSKLDNDLGEAGMKLAASVQTLWANKAGDSSDSIRQPDQAGQEAVSAIISMLRTQIVDDVSQAALAQANYTPQDFINTLS